MPRMVRKQLNEHLAQGGPETAANALWEHKGDKEVRMQSGITLRKS